METALCRRDAWDSQGRMRMRASRTKGADQHRLAGVEVVLEMREAALLFLAPPYGVVHRTGQSQSEFSVAL